MDDSITELLDTIDSSINEFIKSLPDSQSAGYKKVVVLLKQLDLKGDNIKNNVSNWRLLGKIKNELEKAILNPTYTSSLGDFLATFDLVSEIQNSYFSNLTDTFNPMKVLEEIKKQNISTTADALTEQGINQSVIEPIKTILQTNIASGGSYASLTEQLGAEMLGTDELDGSLLRYARTYATDAINQYSAQYTKTISDDLGLEWFRYAGSLIKTSRPFCVALHDKEYFHKSELPQIVKGYIDGKKVSTAGMIDGTTAENFQVNRGGWNCGHLCMPIPEESVPKSLRDKFVEVV